MTTQGAGGDEADDRAALDHAERGSALPRRPEAGWSRRAAVRSSVGALGLGTLALAPAGLLAAGCSGAPPHPTPRSASDGLDDEPDEATEPDDTTMPEPTVEFSGAPAEYTSAANAQDAVALTFHGDGPPALTEALLREAEQAGARVTVLAVGRWLGQNPQLASRILDGGHELGNHTERHLNIDAIGPAAAYAEIEACAARLRQLTGSPGRWFRPSRAQHASVTVLAAARQAGYGTLLSYDVDARDSTDPGPAAVIRNVLGSVRNGDVVSLHLGHRGTVAALPTILDGMRSRGLRAVTASELFPAQGTRAQ